MRYRSHLFSLQLGFGLKQAINEGYSKPHALRDILAGISVGIIAVPLAMALAIACGVPPQHGLYTSIIAGTIIAASGGSRFSVSGPTAAFVVILAPVTSEFGLGGLITATLIAGVILIAMGIGRLGRFIEYIPNSVTLGFTVGIAIVIFTLQVPDVLGISAKQMPEHYWEKLAWIFRSTEKASPANVGIAALTIASLVLWPKWIKRIPPHLPTIVLATCCSWFLARQGIEVDTINSRFHYFNSEGILTGGIPPYLPEFKWPWEYHLPGGSKFELSWDNLRKLLPSSFAIAMLGAIESLLCAVILDGLSGKRHSANSELLGQGIGNIVVPFFGGIPATAAIARSSANFKAGAFSPVSAIVHALIVLASLLFLSSLLGMIPMAAMAALLMVVAWHMSELPKAKQLLKTAPYNDVAVFLVCVSLTVLFDMVIAIAVGIVLASLLFMQNIAEMTKVHDISRIKRVIGTTLPDDVKVFKINGPLFFAAADRIFEELRQESEKLRLVILYLDGVSVLDAGGLNALMKYVKFCETNEIQLYLADFQMQPLKTLARSNFHESETTRTFSTLELALKELKTITE